MTWWELEEALTMTRTVRGLVFDHADEWVAVTGAGNYLLADTEDEALRMALVRGWWGPECVLRSGACMINLVAAIDLSWLARFDDAEAEYRSWASVATRGGDSDQALDAIRFRQFVADPETGRHLLLLLSQGKGDETALRKMMDRIRQSRAEFDARQA